MTTTAMESVPPMVLPALRAAMGDRVYFVSTLRMADIAERIHYAREVHQSMALNDLIQRRLDEKRAVEIAEYLLEDGDRFFNALVVGVYLGDPTWQDFAEITPETPGSQLEVPAYAAETFGFLSLEGGERLFALDGQHRLAGIKQAVSKNAALGEERVPVIFVAHHAGASGLEKTRRLFTVLNKTARPVLKGDIIALDEDDLMAICTRRLIDRCEYFDHGRVAMRLMNSLPPSDRSSWTTVTMLYDLLTILFVDAYPRCRGVKRIPLKALKRRRATDETIDRYYDFALEYFGLLAQQFDAIRTLFVADASASADLVSEHRTSSGGHVLYRPIGQKIFTQVAVALCKMHSLEESIEKLRAVPTALTDAPFNGVIWNPSKGTMVNKGSAAGLARDVLLHMLGAPTRGTSNDLTHRYADFIGKPRESTRLPQISA